MFIYAHKRIPRRTSGLFNDYLYFLKTSSDLLDVLRQMTSDKILVKEYVASRLGVYYVIPTIAIFSQVEKDSLNGLPLPCVVKPAHGNGSIVFLKNNQDICAEGNLEILKNSLNRSPYLTAREKNYKYLRRRLISESMLPDAENTKDYKFFCYRGEPKLIQVDSMRHTAHKRRIYSSKWDVLNFTYNFPRGEIEKAPICLERMLAACRVLSKDFTFVRVDFFVCGERFYVGELTHCPESAHGRFGSVQEEKIFSDILFNDNGDRRLT
jgi:hypothetical protein